MRELLPALVASIREATDALRTRDVGRFQQTVRRQQDIAHSIDRDRDSGLELLRCNPELRRELSSAAAILGNVVGRSSQTAQALLFIARQPDLFYSPETLARR